VFIWRSMVLHYSGELDLSTAAELRETWACAAVIGAPLVRVTCSISVLVGIQRRVRAAGGTYVSCGQSGTRRVIEISGLLDLFEVDKH
jgi:anti-anti-sigma regulatory factor